MAYRMGRLSSSERKILLGILLVLLAVTAAYADHFRNGFHFDDWHTIVRNVNIHNIRNLPRFFSEPGLFSTLPTNQAYQPVTSATLAIDYSLAGGLKPIYFQASTFIWFLAMLVLLFLFFRRIMDLADGDPSNWQFALLATACYGLHPAIAETVNYIIQRADILSTLGVVASLVLYIFCPRWRRWGWYLVPAVIGMLAKAPALIFPAILVCYVFLFETGRSGSRWSWALKSSSTAFMATGATAALIWKMTPPRFSPGGASPLLYRVSQPFVSLHYFKSFFLPTELSADTDWTPVSSLFSAESIIGFAFVAILLAIAVQTSRMHKARPVAFGIIWFFLAQIPTAVTPLAEVTNDHRMFFPFIGLALAVVWTVRLLLWKTAHLEKRARLLRYAWAAAACLLLAAAAGTWQRNRVWRNEESLWLDVTQKSPRNGRGLMNFGLTQMEKGDYATAISYFEKATVYTPNYSLLEINLGIADSGLGRDSDAEKHFQRALALAPQDSQSYFYYAQWLYGKHRLAECLEELQGALREDPKYLDARDLLMQVYFDQRKWSDLERFANETLRLVPDEPAAGRYLTSITNHEHEIAAAEKASQHAPTVNGLINLSLLYYQDGKYPDCILAAKRALQLQPSSAEAYNNIAAAYNAMGRWDNGIQAAKEAARLKPDFELAKNNMLYAIAQRQRSETSQLAAKRP